MGEGKEMIGGGEDDRGGHCVDDWGGMGDRGGLCVDDWGGLCVDDWGGMEEGEGIKN